jgi:hypothetical protein
VGYIRVEELGGGYHPAHKGRGDLGGKQKKRAAGARFGPMQCGGAMNRVEGTLLGQGKLGLRW